MTEIALTINGKKISVPQGMTVAAAAHTYAAPGFRRSVTGQPRGPICGMGICFECRATINGMAQQRTCQTLCAAGMEVITDG
jgi:sarcosine oxidase subunit alpha